jgi:hypothetical protein
VRLIRRKQVVPIARGLSPSFCPRVFEFFPLGRVLLVDCKGSDFCLNYLTSGFESGKLTEDIIFQE